MKMPTPHTPLLDAHVQDIMALDRNDPAYYDEAKAALASFGIGAMIDSSIRLELDAYCDATGES